MLEEELAREAGLVMSFEEAVTKRQAFVEHSVRSEIEAATREQSSAELEASRFSVSEVRLYYSAVSASADSANSSNRFFRAKSQSYRLCAADSQRRISQRRSLWYFFQRSFTYSEQRRRPHRSLLKSNRI